MNSTGWLLGVRVGLWVVWARLRVAWLGQVGGAGLLPGRGSRVHRLLGMRPAACAHVRCRAPAACVLRALACMLGVREGLSVHAHGLCMRPASARLCAWCGHCCQCVHGTGPEPRVTRVEAYTRVGIRGSTPTPSFGLLLAPGFVCQVFPWL